ERFGGDASLVGRTIQLNGQSHTVIGILPAKFVYEEATDVLLPIGTLTPEWLARRDSRPGIYVIGRLKDGVSMAKAQGEMDTIAAAIGKTYPETNRNVGVSITSFVEDTISDARGMLYLLLGAVGLVLLISCANVANLLLARSSARY